MALGAVERGGGVIDQTTHRRDPCLHGQQHAAHIRVADDRRRAAMAATLDPYPGISQGVPVGALGDGETLDADGHAGVVHHGEHAFHTLIFRPHQGADGAPLRAIDHHRRGARVDTELMLERDAAQIVGRPQAAIVID